MGSELERLLDAYRQSLVGGTCGVPNTLSEIATGISPDLALVQQLGPADADDSSHSTEESDDPRSDVGCVKPGSKKAPKQFRPYDSSMAVSSSGLDETGPLSLWAKAMAKYEILNQLKEQYDAAELISDEGGK